MQSGAHIKVAAIQLQGRVGDITGNLQLARDMADQAFANGARIVALPEFFATPVMVEHPFRRCAIDSASNPALEMMRSLARRHNGFIGGSLVMSYPNGTYNSYLLVEPDGSFHTHNKDLPSMWENCHFEGGHDDGVFPTALGGIGAAVCWEMIRTQTVRRLRGKVSAAMTGNHWWNTPNNWPLLSRLLDRFGRINQRISEQMPQHFARLLGVPVLHASHCGPVDSRFLLTPGSMASVSFRSEFVGATQIVDSDGTVLAYRSTRDGPGIVEANLGLGARKPVDELDESRYWIPELTWLHRLYWNHHNACGKWVYAHQKKCDQRLSASSVPGGAA